MWLDLHEIATNLERDLSRLQEWLTNNGMVANPNNFQRMFLGLRGQRRLQLNINENILSATDHAKLLGIEVDNKLKFNKHVKTLCSKVNKKISAFSRLNYYPLIWLFCNKGAHKEIDRTRKRAIWIPYKDYECPFETLLNRSGSYFKHVRNVQKLMTETYVQFHESS